MLRLAIPVLHVASVARAEAFYCERLGFEKRFAYRLDPARPDPCYLGLVRDDAWLHASSFADDGVAGAAVHLLVDHVDRLHEELRAKSVAIDLEPTDQTWGNREMYVRDPDGNCIRFIEAGPG
jgi:catechol 2,3-dioxygenase-like lactoylglutathione lyase family enzyme